MSFDQSDPIQLLQLRVGALEFIVKQLAAIQSVTALELIEENTKKQIEIWKEKSPEIVEVMEFALDILPKK
ncbi:hypothetical protein ABW06_24600 [Pluralibacter gergoviae]|uniref:Uncharacterized protein n=1 Tax=Pluralibacter gergoviae TaxID=61647 RepID=A0A0J5KR52_PLUGE|nr:hypothetical protein [Pluralibacter gergoviae]KMK08524.1 hypothetical protein ABW06_24600 [Pluralibacter gergoviae]